MKTYDLATIIVITSFLAVIGKGMHEPSGPLFECERVDQGGYFTYADPTCAQ